MSVTDLLSIAGIVFGIVGPFIAWLWKTLVDKRLDDLQEAQEADKKKCSDEFEAIRNKHVNLQLEISRDYVRHEHLSGIKQTLDKIWEKLDGKQDRPNRRTIE